MSQQPNNPLHGISLATMVTELELRYGWDGLAQRININCFKSDPSVKSALKFLRKTPWAREKVENLYVRSLSQKPAKERKPKQSNATDGQSVQAKVNPWGTRT